MILEKRGLLKYFLIVMMILGSVIGFSKFEFEATSGKLKSASICHADGVAFGNHGDGHWHYATQHDSGWYPSGGSFGYDNPCTQESYNEPEQEPVVESAPEPEIIPEPIFVPSISSKKDSIEIYDTFYSKSEFHKEDIIELFSLTFDDGEGNKVGYNKQKNPRAKIMSVEISPETIENKIGKNELEVTVINDSNQQSTKKIVLNIIKNNVPTINQLKNIKETRKPPKASKMIASNIFEVTDIEGGVIKLTEENIQIDTKNGKIIITVVDKHNGSAQSEFPYKLKKKSKLFGIFPLGHIFFT